MNKPRILLVDDVHEVLLYCKTLLEVDYDIVGAASSGKAALAAVEALQPDVILLDISMPGLSGIEVAKRLRGSRCRAAIVFVSADDDLVGEALRAGGSAYVSKSRINSDLHTAIDEALAGRLFVSITEDPGKCRTKS